jgi:hypothetical protein
MSVITVRRTVRTGGPKRTATTRRSFRELTRRFVAHELKWQFVIEAVLFAIIVAISAWPILAVADALNEFLKRAPS